MMNLTFQNERRQAVINKNTLHCLHDTGKVRKHWVSCWPPVEIPDTRKLKRYAVKWVENAELPANI